MIKLIDLLREVEEKEQLSPEEQKIASTLSPEDRDEYVQALRALRNDNTEPLEEGIKDKIKKMGLSAAVVAALLSTPSIVSAQKTDQKSTQSTTQTVTPRIGTRVDSIMGSWTSRFQFPREVLRDTTAGTVKDLGVEGNKALQKLKSNLPADKMIAWNNFQSWMVKNGYAGDEKMDKGDFGLSVLNKYRKENPSFWMKGPEDIAKVQACLKDYRAYAIAMWKIDKANIEIKDKDGKGKKLVPGKDDNQLDQFMSWAR